MWSLARLALVLFHMRICETAAPGAPLRAVQCVCGDICCLRGGPVRGVGIGKAAEQPEEPPLGVPQDTRQQVPGAGKPGEGPLLSGRGWGGAECQKPSGQVDRCVCSICLVPGAWQMECRDQAAENLDQFQTAPFPRLKAEHFLRAAMEPGAQGAPRQRRFHWNLAQSPVSLAQGIVGPTEHSLA